MVRDRVIAMRNFTTTEENTLTLNQGDIITVLTRPSVCWWLGKIGEGRPLSQQLRLLNTARIRHAITSVKREAIVKRE